MSLANSKTNTSTKRKNYRLLQMQREKNPLLTKIINNHLQMRKKTDTKDIVEFMVAVIVQYTWSLYIFSFDRFDLFFCVCFFLFVPNFLLSLPN